MRSFGLLYFVIGAAVASPAPQQGARNNSCSSSQLLTVSELVSGIQANLDIQAQELKGIQTLQKLDGFNMSANQPASNTSSDFQLMQTAVLAIQQRGIDIRANNQKLASQINSPSQQGLAVVAMAQVTEKMQVQSLTGTGGDAMTLNTLLKEVQDGTNQNTRNLQAAASQCN